MTPWTAAHQASLSSTTSRSLLKLLSIESMMPSNHLILCRSLLLLPSRFPSIRAPRYNEWFISGYFSVEQMDVTPLWFHQSDTANGRLKQHVMFSFLTTQRRKEYFHAFYGILYYISNTCSLQMGNERNYIIGNKSGPSSQHPVITLTFSDVSFRPLSARV